MIEEMNVIYEKNELVIVTICKIIKKNKKAKDK